MPQTVDLKKYASILGSTVLFSGMSDLEINKAGELLRVKIGVYGKGEFLRQPYTDMNMFGMVLSGAVQVCMDDVAGNRMIMAEVSPGITFGEALCFLGVKESPVYIQASRASEILWFSIGSLFCDGSDPLSQQLQRRFTAMLAARTLSMNDRIQVLSKIRLRDKLICYFSQLVGLNKTDFLRIPMNREDLAAYLGTDRSALSRELSRMKKDGLIDYHKNTVRILKHL